MIYQVLISIAMVISTTIFRFGIRNNSSLKLKDKYSSSKCQHLLLHEDRLHRDGSLLRLLGLELVDSLLVVHGALAKPGNKSYHNF